MLGVASAPLLRRVRHRRPPRGSPLRSRRELQAKTPAPTGQGRSVRYRATPPSSIPGRKTRARGSTPTAAGSSPATPGSWTPSTTAAGSSPATAAKLGAPPSDGRLARALRRRQRLGAGPSDGGLGVHRRQRAAGSLITSDGGWTYEGGRRAGRTSDGGHRLRRRRRRLGPDVRRRVDLRGATSGWTELSRRRPRLHGGRRAAGSPRSDGGWVFTGLVVLRRRHALCNVPCGADGGTTTSGQRDRLRAGTGRSRLANVLVYVPSAPGSRTLRRGHHVARPVQRRRTSGDPLT